MLNLFIFISNHSNFIFKNFLNSWSLFQICPIRGGMMDIQKKIFPLSFLMNIILRISFEVSPSFGDIVTLEFI